VSSGVLVVDKPVGMTSAAVVAEVKRRLGARRVGHTGTLDPLASGVLPVCVDEATKLAAWLLADDKAYQVELELGVETDTLDADGQVVRRDAERAAAVTESMVAAAVAGLEGERMQVPPMYSAIKQGGVRLHQLARAGVEVERTPRPIRIDRCRLTGFDPPRARFEVDCSKGTYVRVLVEELGAQLGCGAHMTGLRRTRAGGFDLSMAIGLGAVDEGAPLIGLADAVGHLPGQVVAADQVAAVRAGRVLPWSALAGAPAPPGPLRLIDPAGELLAIAEVTGGQVRYQRVFLAAK